LLVCTGNTCRSPMAEHLFRKLLKEKGKEDVEIQSAGTSPSPWLEFPQRAREVLAEEGVKDVSHTAQGVEASMVESTQIILVMERRHKEFVEGEFPEAKGKVFLLKEYAGIKDSSPNIQDPFGQSRSVYAKVLSEIKKALILIIKDKI